MSTALSPHLRKTESNTFTPLQYFFSLLVRIFYMNKRATTIPRLRKRSTCIMRYYVTIRIHLLYANHPFSTLIYYTQNFLTARVYNKNQWLRNLFSSLTVPQKHLNSSPRKQHSHIHIHSHRDVHLSITLYARVREKSERSPVESGRRYITATFISSLRPCHAR